ncbi:MAG: S1/P1 nuclease [Paludibacteraceae bacterium]|nr:S1/P1 nuclease [Paludibacteraceae bacterium]
MRNKIYYIIFALMFYPVTVSAWGPMGHRVIAEVAYSYMTGNAIRQVDEQLGKHGMVYWSTWPDEIKSKASLYPTSYDWHFQDLQGGLNDAQLISTLTHYPDHGGNLWKVLDLLSDSLQQPQDTYIILNEKMSYHDALVFFIHLRADALCPMHVAREEDKGGNLIEMQWFGQATNLHTVWDEKLIESRGYSYSEYAQMLVDKYDKLTPLMLSQSREDDLIKVYAITQAIYDYQEKGDTNTYHYIWTWSDLCDWLLYTSGLRIAQYLNTLYR